MPNRRPAYFVFFVAAALLSASSCEQKVHVTYVVPAGFRGIIAIGERAGGSSPSRGSSGAVTFKIPANGILAVSDASAFGKWHTFEAQYADGTKLPIYPVDRTPTDPERIMFFELDATGDHTWNFFVGTEAGYNSAREMSRPPVPK